MTSVGFLGLGRMGAAIAGRLAAADVPLVIWNRSAAAGDDLVAAGATRADTAAEALAAPVSFSMLADDRAADAVLSTENLGASAGPRIHVNMASISTAMADTLSDALRGGGRRLHLGSGAGSPRGRGGGQAQCAHRRPVGCARPGRPAPWPTAAFAAGGSASDPVRPTP